jgi:hypothetical protein
MVRCLVTVVVVFAMQNEKKGKGQEQMERRNTVSDTAMGI